MLHVGLVQTRHLIVPRYTIPCTVLCPTSTFLCTLTPTSPSTQLKCTCTNRNNYTGLFFVTWERNKIGTTVYILHTSSFTRGLYYIPAPTHVALYNIPAPSHAYITCLLLHTWLYKTYLLLHTWLYNIPAPSHVALYNMPAPSHVAL